MRIEAINESHSKSDISPEILLFCSVMYALAVTLSCSIYALIVASVIPLVLIMRNRISLIKLNVFNLIMIITLALTWPNFTEGLMKGIIIALRVNMIYIVFAVKIYPIGYAKIFSALNVLKIPEKLRILLLLTMRGIFIMHERFTCALISLRLRAKNLHGLMKLKAFAYITCSVLIQSSRRSERMMLAIQSRGGFSGFIQSEDKGVNIREVIVCLCFSIYALMIIILNYA